MQLLRFHVLAGRADHRVGGSKNGLVGIAERARIRQFAAESLADHRQRALCEIAEVVRQIRIDAVDDRLMAVVAILAERHLAQEEVAELVDAVGSASVKGSITLPTDFDIFSPRLNKNPWAKIRFGTATPADIKKAGQ